MMDEMKDKAQDAIGEHGDKIDEGMDRAGDFADEKTGGDHREQIDKGVDRGKEAIDDMGR
jgi:hypothetical protein